MNIVAEADGTFVELGRRRAAEDGERTAYVFSSYQSETCTRASLSYRELDARARATAAELQKRVSQGSRVLLLYRAGLDFVSGFLGCLYAGMIAVPVSAPKFGQRSDRLLRIMEDCSPATILSTGSVRKGLQSLVDPSETLSWLLSETVMDSDAVLWQERVVEPSDIAFLQYSSGSTGHPKGIQVSHANLAHQSAVFHQATGATRESCFVSWLPAFHDLGLIAGILQPLYGGYPGVLMAPESFIEAPIRWLQAISDYRADISAAPNFAYELCLARVGPEERAGLDLGCWRFALNGAEPVRAKTIEEFTVQFASTGFRRSAFYPAYGLAEATLLVSGGCPQGEVQPKHFVAAALEENRVAAAAHNDRNARILVGTALPVADQTIVIVDPVTGLQAAADEVGEVWVSSPSVAAGYWGKQSETEEIFRARVTGDGAEFLRTGDLGFVLEGELFICGRWKDLIRMRGRNHHAPDIELTVENAHRALRPGCGAAFSIDVDETEALVVAHEIDRQFKVADAVDGLDGIILAVRQAIAEQHQLQAFAVVLLRHGTLPKTSSGKLQRRECRQRYLAGRLNVRAAWPPLERTTRATDAYTEACAS